MKISQEAREAAEQLEDMEWPGNHALYTHMIEQHLQSLINTTLERAAVVASEEFEYAATQHNEDQVFGAQAACLRIEGAIRQMMESE